ncbi:disulfide bond formation protein B [Wolbachia endosymbiont of Howardula sp.]|uniref:disulfide bond formation protein B n=1 Tax=Wolbachia endosymbiont of Howardula sp. TaxID=2916816 RepID=UPI00217EFD3C|nr:disulfide bond formation protein B [Wolbachia endosymbiont of Howardula sp.]UWI83038.1 disulfide bond formation protein B [Wolbachia endosymbiont of Howardula sp.]
MHTNILFLFSSIISLITAYIIEYIFNILPCTLCIYQRMIYYIVLSLSILYIIKNYQVFIYIIYCVYFIGVLISFYHIGIESYWFHNIVGCTDQLADNLSIEQIRENFFQNTYSISCNSANYIFNISLATWNFIYLLIILLGSGIIYANKNKT